MVVALHVKSAVHVPNGGNGTARCAVPWTAWGALKVPVTVFPSLEPVNVCGSAVEIGMGPKSVKYVNVQIEPAMLKNVICPTDVPSVETERFTEAVCPGGGAE